VSDLHFRPGLVLGRYPQQQDTWPDALENFVKRNISAMQYVWRRRQFSLVQIVKQVNRYEPALKTLSDQALQTQVKCLQQKLYQQGLQDDLIFQTFAAIREASHRVLGKKHFDVQLFGGWVMMNGMIAEMETGQGKTLTATLPACTAALAGIPVHVMTANDYLAARDEVLLRPLYQWLGISSASVVDGMENDARSQAYSCSIVYTTSQQIAFDYLRDRMEMKDDIGNLQIQFKQIQSQHLNQPSPFLLRGLCFGLLDEADSLLIDEAKTPLIISKTREDEEQNQNYYDALYLASSLDNDKDFTLDEQNQSVNLTAAGKTRLEKLVESLHSDWQRRRQREFLATMALKAKYLFQRDEHYLVRNGKVEIIDPLTGRSMPDRSWEQGLHQLVEVKEGCEISGIRDPLARISYQTFFKRYLRLSGMSGTVSEVANELIEVYDLRVVKIPTHQPSRRILRPEWVLRNSEQKWQAFIRQVAKVHQTGQPVLIGTRSVAESEQLSAILTQHNLPHQVLNARQDHQEAELVAQAGLLGSITVATNMAGRGTDIALGEGVSDIGGLFVISTARNDARRIDRQLYGRCARQGDPGIAQGFMSLQDITIVEFYPAFILRALSVCCVGHRPMPNWLGKIVLAIPQRWLEHKHRRIRGYLIEQEKQQAKLLSFSGRME
jgi:preprotein translocase subunit SecA